MVSSKTGPILVCYSSKNVQFLAAPNCSHLQAHWPLAPPHCQIFNENICTVIHVHMVAAEAPPDQF